jgi:hypothetical protein
MKERGKKERIKYKKKRVETRSKSSGMRLGDPPRRLEELADVSCFCFVSFISFSHETPHDWSTCGTGYPLRLSIAH